MVNYLIEQKETSKSSGLIDEDEDMTIFGVKSLAYIQENLLSLVINQFLEMISRDFKILFLKSLRISFRKIFKCDCWSQAPSLPQKTRYIMVESIHKELLEFTIKDNFFEFEPELITLAVKISFITFLA